MNIKYDYYLKTYKDHIRDSFSGFWRKGLLNKLLGAIDLWNKNECEKAVNTLLSLRKSCKTVNEHCAVLMFMALCYDDMRYFAPAIAAYKEILELDPTRSSAQSNLGLLYRQMGEYGEAVQIFQAAIESDPKNPFAYNNLALTYYRMTEYGLAIEAAEKALALKANLYQAANCLCLCHYILKNKEECKKYYKIAVTNGSDPKKLKEEIEKLKYEDGLFAGADDAWWDL